MVMKKKWQEIIKKHEIESFDNWMSKNGMDSI